MSATEEVLVSLTVGAYGIIWATIAVWCNGKRMGEMRLIVCKEVVRG